jgi:hypothetical protein
VDLVSKSVSVDFLKANEPDFHSGDGSGGAVLANTRTSSSTYKKDINFIKNFTLL